MTKIVVKQKGFYPNEYMRDFEKCKEQFPSKKKFYNSSTGEKISDKEYEHGLKVWNKCGMKTMKDYHNLHLKYDALLLADVFPSHCLSAPALTWDASS